MAPSEPGTKAPNRWFAAKRCLFIRNLYKDFYQTYSGFLDLFDEYIATWQVPYASIDQLVGTESRKGSLWLLKDNCHRLWRDADPKQEVHGCLLDWVMGSLFHEAMKLKENIYMYQFYRPLAAELSSRQDGGVVTFCGMEARQFMESTVREMRKQLENLGFMFGRANYLLRIMLTDQGGNMLLLRYLIETEAVVIQLWSETLVELLGEMFPGFPEQGFLLAGKSYLEDQWLTEALAAFRQVLALNGEHEEARRFVLQLEAIVREAPAAAIRSEAGW